MALLIDGYNLLHVTGIFDHGKGPGGFQRTRDALIRFLIASIEEKQHKRTTVVFDAAQAPSGLPAKVSHGQITVRYAKGYPDADTLIEEIIEQHRSPRSLVVVSSDHRIQRAARRRGADYIDSDLWYAKLRRQQRMRDQGQKQIRPEKPSGKLSESEINYWLEEFSSDDSNEVGMSAADSEQGRHPSNPPAGDTRFENPFPPGYADDLFEEQ